MTLSDLMEILVMHIPSFDSFSMSLDKDMQCKLGIEIDFDRTRL